MGNICAQNNVWQKEDNEFYFKMKITFLFDKETDYLFHTLIF